MAFRHGFPVLPLLILASCSLVKENRESCPCYLELRVHCGSEASLILKSGNYESIVAVPGDTALTVPVPRGSVSVTGVAGVAPELLRDGISIPKGYDCPSLYLFTGEADTSGETASLDVTLHKHYCSLSLSIEGPPGWGEPYWVEVHGPVCGVSLSGEPREGEFSCRLDRGMSVRLPRQDPGTPLTMDIVMPDHVLRTFSLGNYMLSAGYDWTAPDLGDLELNLRLSVTSISLTTPSTLPTETMNITI